VRVLVVPVGGSPDAVAQAVAHARPGRIVWFASEDSRSLVEGLIERAERDLGRGLHWNETVETPDPSDLQATFAVLHERLPQILRNWGCSWEDVVVDITGGTKPMIAALTLASVRGAHEFQYVSGERDKGGLGVVRTGTERPVALANPWEALAVDVERDIARDFNSLRFARAREMAEQAKKRLGDTPQGGYLAKLGLLASAFGAWDRFDFKEATEHLKRCRDVLAQAWLARPGHGHLVNDLAAAEERLRAVHEDKRTEAPSRLLLEELLASALRRAEEGRYDDAVARLYRFVEGFAQLCLWEAYGIRTGSVDDGQIPRTPDWEPLRARAEDGQVKLGLRDAYRLLFAKGHPAGRAAQRLETAQPLSLALDARNRSLLAHGTTPVRSEDYARLLDEACALSDTDRERLFRFPRLPEA
jgi:CRISPR-associated protein (TIGR02710 family)